MTDPDSPRPHQRGFSLATPCDDWPSWGTRRPQNSLRQFDGSSTSGAGKTLILDQLAKPVGMYVFDRRLGCDHYGQSEYTAHHLILVHLCSPCEFFGSILVKECQTQEEGMTQLHAPIRYGASAFALVDNLINALKRKGILTEEEAQQVIADAVSGVRRSPDPAVQRAADLLLEVYPPIQGR